MVILLLLFFYLLLVVESIWYGSLFRGVDIGSNHLAAGMVIVTQARSQSGTRKPGLQHQMGFDATSPNFNARE